MPNGGGDNCGDCPLNRAWTHPQDDPSRVLLSWEFAESFCTLRKVAIRNPFGTYCRNYHGSLADEPVGPIFVDGLSPPHHTRIPWDAVCTLRVGVAARCRVCTKTVAEGITKVDGTKTIGFCSNEHYIEWWNSPENERRPPG